MPTKKKTVKYKKKTIKNIFRKKTNKIRNRCARKCVSCRGFVSV